MSLNKMWLRRQTTKFNGTAYIWIKCTEQEKSWDYFDRLLEEAQVIGTPGIGFGNNGEGYFRLTAFNTKENTIEALKRIKKMYKG